MNGAKVPRITLRQERLLAMQRRRRLQDRISDMITDFAGSMQFVYLHVVWFAVWTIGNLLWWRFDPFPFGLLTLIVSLEAIFLSTFVMISQNRESARSDFRSEIDFETDMLSEVWLEAVAAKLGIDVDQVHSTAEARIKQAKARASDNGDRQATPA
ncbi:MAG TPA: DUF1003 domain-containing protein [Streptosporangiaceae bacterium]|jgi:uncharacterized membrane protein